MIPDALVCVEFTADYHHPLDHFVLSDSLYLPSPSRAVSTRWFKALISLRTSVNHFCTTASRNRKICEDGYGSSPKGFVPSHLDSGNPRFVQQLMPLQGRTGSCVNSSTRSIETKGRMPSSV